MLIGTNTDITYKEVKYGLGKVSVGDYKPIYDSQAVCKYVSKQIGKIWTITLFLKNEAARAKKIIKYLIFRYLYLNSGR